ncbi:unnamed protein product [Calicophoron daubneyi]|uniref:U3 small nucleolar RNA-associated protein 11 n=1 Tax=Calicophoron daubneyi TaxID=300641 RepID=A0AAV2TBP7_CALDB
MPFASFKNIQKRYARTHKERSQPEHRQRLGLLPKKKDFVLRARDKEKKQEKIKDLRRKALTKNEDEFYFNMCNSTFDVEKGHIPLNCAVTHSEEEVRSLLSLSVIQLRHELQKEVSKIRKLESSVNLIHGEFSRKSAKGPQKHVYFADTKAEAEEIYATARPCLDNQAEPLEIDILEDRQAAYSELEQRLRRAEVINLMLKKREAKQKLTRNIGRKYKVVAKETKNAAPVYQFDQVRYH